MRREVKPEGKRERDSKRCTEIEIEEGIEILYLWGWVDGELQLGLLAIVHRETLHQQRGEARTSSSSKRVEDQESLESSAHVRQLPDPIEDEIHDLLADGVVAPGVVVGGVLLACDQLLRMEQLPISSSADLI